MSIWARIAALVAAAVTLSGVTAKAGSPLWPFSDPQVQPASANGDVSCSRPDYYDDQNTATYPPKKSSRTTHQPANSDEGADSSQATNQSQPPKRKPTQTVRRADGTQPVTADGRPIRRGVTQASRMAEEPMAPTPAGKAPMGSAMSAPMGPSPEYGPAPHELLDGQGEGCPDCGEGGCCFNCIHWCGGVDYLLLRPRFSNDTALTTITASGVGTPTATTANNVVDYNYDYNSDIHAFVGFATESGGVRFGYWRLQDSANASATASGNFAGGDGTAVQGIATSEIITPGSTLNVTSHIHVDLWDIDRLVHLDLPSCMSGWDVNWLYGVRIGNFHRTIDEFDPIETVNIGSSFVGAGPRIGLEAHRHLGCSRFSTFVDADAALLVGNFKGDFTSTTPGDLQTTVSTTHTDQERVVPTFGLAIGMAWSPTCNTTVTGGYMVEAFSDAIGNNGALGCTNCGNTGTTPGTGNILSFDGIFIRLQHCF